MRVSAAFLVSLSLLVPGCDALLGGDAAPDESTAANAVEPEGSPPPKAAAGDEEPASGSASAGAGALQPPKSTRHTVAVGFNHSCALHGGAAYCFGGNVGGQLGDGSTDSTSVPQRIGLEKPIDLAVGNEFSCALEASGSVVCWGLGDGGELGRGAREQDDDPSPPGPVEGLTDAVAIGGGNGSVCAVKKDASVACWGRGFFFMDSKTAKEPRVIEHLSGAQNVEVGADFACALLADRSVSCWGRDIDRGQAPQGEGPKQYPPTPVAGLAGVKQIGVRGLNSCALLDSGVVECWAGVTGRPEPIEGIQGAQLIGVSDSRGCALTASGVRCWTGNGSSVEGVQGLSSVEELAVSEKHACARVASGVRCWGEAESGQLGEADQLPMGYTEFFTEVEVAAANLSQICAYHHGKLECLAEDGPVKDPFPGLTNAAEMAADRFEICAIDDAGKVSCGRPESENPAPKKKLHSLAVGFGLACALDPSTKHWCWSHGEKAERQDMGLGKIADLAEAKSHRCALEAKGDLHCWGGNEHAQLGTGRTNDTRKCQHPKLGGKVAEVGASETYTCARTKSGKVACWGARGKDPGPPRFVTPLDDAIQLSVGDNWGCAVTADHEVVCWGANTGGQHGDGTTSSGSEEEPVEALGIRATQVLATWVNYACAILEDRSLVCWGDIPDDLARHGKSLIDVRFPA